MKDYLSFTLLMLAVSMCMGMELWPKGTQDLVTELLTSEKNYIEYLEELIYVCSF